MKDNINVNYGPLPEYISEDKKEYLDLLRSPLQDYCKEAIKQFGYLDNQGLALDDDDNQDGPVYIDDLYVLPKAGEERISPEMLAEIDDIKNTNNDSEDIEDVKNKVDQLSSISELIWKNPRLTLLGDPGVGKTTLMQWLICSLCHWSNNHAKQYLGSMFPLTITARKIPEKTALMLSSSDLDIEDFVDEILSMQGDQLYRLWGEEEKSYLYSLFERGQVLLLVDGLDEISSNAEFWLNDNIRSLLIRYPSTHLIMTARVVGFNQFDFWGVSDSLRNKQVHIAGVDELGELDEKYIQFSNNNQLHLPSIFFLAPFSPDQRKRFSENWVANYLPPNNEIKKNFIENIDEVSEHSFQLDALSRIPVLLNLICFIQWRRGKLPNGRAELYQKIVETYLVAMDRARLLTHELGDEYDYQDIKNWLGRLAFNMQSGDLKILDGDKKLSDFDEDELELLRNDIPNIHQERILQVSSGDLESFFQLHLTEVLPLAELEEHSEAIIKYLKNRTGFLIPRGVVNGLEMFGFSHLSFQEYFSAYFLNNIIDSFCDTEFSGFVKSTSRQSWSEIFQLFFEEMSLTGRSRTYVDKKLRSVFCFDKETIDGENVFLNHSSLFPTYSKIISNPSVKISNSTRKEKKKELALLYVSSAMVAHPVIAGIANEVFEGYVSDGIKISREEIHITDVRLKNISDVIDYDLVSFLSIDKIDVNDYGFKNVFNSLTCLILSESTIDSFERICIPSQLKVLSVISSEISDLSSFYGMNNLTDLSISGDILESVYRKLPSLSRLTILPGRQKDFNFDYLSDLGGIEDFRVFGNFSEGLPYGLDGVKLKKIEYFGDFDVSIDFEFEKLVSLKEISLYNISSQDDEFLNMDSWGYLKEIESLMLNVKCNIDVGKIPRENKLAILSVYRGKLINQSELLNITTLKKLLIRAGSIKSDIITSLEDKGVSVELI